MTSTTDEVRTPRVERPVLDYRLLRLLVGLIAFFLPFAVSLYSSISLSSISVSRISSQV